MECVGSWYDLPQKFSNVLLNHSQPMIPGVTSVVTPRDHSAPATW